MYLVYLLPYTLAPALAHTWIEQLTIVDVNNTIIGEPGFMRGFGIQLYLNIEIVS